MRCSMSVTGLGDPKVCALPEEFARHEPSGSVALVWRRGNDSGLLVVTCEQLAALCDQVIEWVPTTDEVENGEKPSDN